MVPFELKLSVCEELYEIDVLYQRVDCLTYGGANVNVPYYDFPGGNKKQKSFILFLYIFRAGKERYSPPYGKINGPQKSFKI